MWARRWRPSRLRPTREQRKVSGSSSEQNFHHFIKCFAEVESRHPGSGVGGLSRTVPACEDKSTPLLSSAARSLQVALLAVPPPSASLLSSSFVLRLPLAPLRRTLAELCDCKSHDSVFRPPSASEGSFCPLRVSRNTQGGLGGLGGGGAVCAETDSSCSVFGAKFTANIRRRRNEHTHRPHVIPKRKGAGRTLK